MTTPVPAGPMTTWVQILAIVVSYCGGKHTPAIQDVDKCRMERMKCAKRGAQVEPTREADILVSDCLSGPNSFPEPKVTTVQTPAPTAKAK